MKSSSSSEQRFEQLWAELPEHLAQPWSVGASKGMEARFLQRFEQELGEEERRRQHRAWQAKSVQSQPQPNHTRWWSWSIFSYGLWASATAACILVIWTWYPGKPSSPSVSSPRTTVTQKTTAKPNGSLHAPSSNRGGVFVQKSIQTPIAQVPSVEIPQPEQSPALYQDLQLYEKMEILEKMKLLEQLPSLTKGS